jgi:hypothetical protein
MPDSSSLRDHFSSSSRLAQSKARLVEADLELAEAPGGCRALVLVQAEQRAVAVSVDIHPIRHTRRLPVDEHQESHGRTAPGPTSEDHEHTRA